MTLKTAKTNSTRASQRPWLSAFRRDEDGSLIIFGLFMLLLMLMVGGLAVDLMRLETTRAKLQGTSDRCVLAAADLDQTQDPTFVVNDCMTKAGMQQYMDGPPIVDQGLNYRIVTANVRADVPMLFSNLLSVFGPTEDFGTLKTMSVPANATAEERITDVEISLVVDMSSSMQQNSKLQNLRAAAKEFITTVLENNHPGSDGLTTVSMIPYSAVVNMGSTLAGYYNLTSQHTASFCPLIPTATFSDTWISRTPTYTRVSNFDYGAETNTSVSPITRPWCFRPTENPIIVHSYNEAALKTAVDNLVSFGNTAIDLGVMWGSSLLDPRSQPIVTGMIASGQVQSEAAGRPVSWTANDNLKVIVLMTDGENTTEYDLSTNYNGVDYKNGMSTLWVNKQSASQAWGAVPTNRFSVQYGGVGTATRNDDQFIWLGQSSGSRYYNYPNGFPGGQNGYRTNANQTAAAGRGIDYTPTIRHFSWQDIYSTWVRTTIYNKFYNEPYSYGNINYTTYVNTYYALSAVVNDTQADARLSSACRAARDQGVVIYTVAFEAPSGGQAALLDCASSPSHFYDVSGTNISVAFAAIASDIARLKLTN